MKITRDIIVRITYEIALDYVKKHSTDVDTER